MTMIRLKEKIVDNLYRYVLEWRGLGVQQDFPIKQDMKLVAKRFKKEIKIEKEKKNDELVSEVRPELA